ncbi:uncharacterized protein LOC144115942 isoform X3 [Amblyomma americanum]
MLQAAAGKIMHRPARPYKDSTESAQLPEMEPELPPVESVCRKLDADLVASSALKVYLRLRPCVGSTPFTKPAFEPHSETTVASTTATLEHQQQKCFNFTKVFPEGSSQEQLFQGVVEELLDAFIEGKNVLLFAYGPTAGGKTHTMQGPCTDPGIVPRTLHRLFHLLGTQICQGAPVRPDCFDEVVQLNTTEEAAVLQLKNQLLGEKGARSAADFSTFHLPRNGSDASLFLSRSSTGSHDSAGQVLLWLSLYEIYNEGIYDLLLPSVEAPTKKGAKGTCRTLLKLGEDHAKRFFIRGLIEVPIHTADEAHRLLCLAYHNRSIAETRLNRNSSRSHCVFTVRLVATGAGSQDWHVSSLMLCDLAGSENPSKSGTDGSRLREAGRINTSLMVLSRCLEGLRRNKDAAKKVPVPFRESKLTKVMQAYFTTGGQVSLVVNISPSMAMFEESLNALKFSAIACQVVPLQLEPRHERCRQAVRRLTEVWSNARASTGEGDSFMTADSSAGPAILSPAETDELFDMVTALQQELDNTQKVLRCNERMLSASRAEVADYKNLVAEMERTQRELSHIADREMAIRIRNACEITRLDLYRKAEAGSTMELLGRCEEAERRVAELTKLLDEGSDRHNAEERHLSVTPLMDDKAVQTDEGAAAEREAEGQLAAAGVELESLRCLLEEMSSQLACEVQARRDAEDSAQQAHEELSTVSEKVAEEVAHSSNLQQRIEQVERDAGEALQHATSELGQELEQLRRHMQEHELSLRKQLDDKDKALRGAELSLHALKEDLEREVAVRKAAEERCTKLAMELEDTTESAREAKQSLRNMQSCLEKANAKLPDCRKELAARELSSHKAAMELVEAKEEELRCLRPAADENNPLPTQRTTRTSRATRMTSSTRKESTDGEAGLRTRAQRPRRVKKSMAVSKDPLDDDDVACRRPVLADGNSESSPLKRLGEKVVDMFSRSANDGATASTRTTRRHQLLPADQGFVEVEDEEPPPSACKATGRRRAKH